MNLEQAARKLTIHQPCLTYYEALQLLLGSYERLQGAAGYGDLLQSCMKIEWGILVRLTEEQLKQRLAS